MRIYVAHPTGIDYENEIYRPLRKDNFFLEHELILPHKNGVSISNSREDYKNYNIVIAECSKPSIGVGIELGWFYDEGKPIYCFYKEGTKLSSAIRNISEQMVEYRDGRDFVDKIKGIVKMC